MTLVIRLQESHLNLLKVDMMMIVMIIQVVVVAVIAIVSILKH